MANFFAISKKWQKEWEKSKVFQTKVSKKKKKVDKKKEKKKDQIVKKKIFLILQ